MDFYYGLGTFGLFDVDGAEVTSALLGSGSQFEDATASVVTLRLTPGGVSSANMELTLKFKTRGVSQVNFQTSADGVTTSLPPVVVSQPLAYMTVL